MKKRHRFIHLLLGLILLVGNMSACRSDHGSPADPSNTDQDASARLTASEAYSDVLAPNEVQMRNVSMVTIHNGYLYYFQKIDLGLTSAHIIRKRNLETGEISSPCIDPLCSHLDADCPFYCGSYFRPMFFFGDWMLVQWEGSALAPDEQGKAHTQKTFTRVLYNQKTGERRDVFPIQDPDAITDSMFFFDGEKIYHALYQKSTTDPETGEKYVPCEVVAHDLKTGREVSLFSRKYDITLFCVTNSHVYFYETLPGDDGKDKNIYYSYSKETEQIREEPTFALSAVRFVCKNRLYVDDAEQFVCMINDVTTGEVYQAAEELGQTVSTIFVTEDHIYYLSKEGVYEYWKATGELWDQYLLDKANLKGSELKARRVKYDEDEAALRLNFYRKNCSLWRSDLNGENPEKVLDLPGFYFATIYVEGEYLYTKNYFYDTETGEPLYTAGVDDVWCRIHFGTGEKELLDDVT